MKKATLERGTAASVLEVVRVSVESGKIKSTEKDTVAMAFVQDAGFIKLKCTFHRVEAEKGPTNFLLEYDVESPANKKKCRLIAVNGDVFQEIDSGLTEFAPLQPNGDNTTEIDFTGQAMHGWEVHCKIANPKIQAAYDLANKRGQIKPAEVWKQKIPEAAHRPTPPAKPAPQEPKPAAPKAPVTALAPRVTTPTAPARIVTPTAPPSVNGVYEEVVLMIPLDEVIAFQPQDDAPAFTGQPRTEFSETDLLKLARSIKKHGQRVAAIVCRYTGPIPGIKWELIAGERRWRACRIAGVPFIRAVEFKPRDKKAQHLLSLIENLHRKDPSYLELSDALAQQIRAGETQLTLCEELSLSYTQIQKLLSIQTLLPELKELLKPSVPAKQRMRLNQAAALGRIKAEEQVRIWNEAKTEITQGLIYAKICELGRPHMVYKREMRNDRRNEVGEKAKRLERSVNRLTATTMELNQFTQEEVFEYVTLRGEELEPTVKMLDRVLTDVGALKKRIQVAQAARKAVRESSAAK